MIRLEFTKEELEYLYFAVQNYTPLDGIENLSVEKQFELYETVKNKIEHEFIADHIFDLLEDLEYLSYDLHEEWCDKLWYDDAEDGRTIAVKRDPKIWTWATVGQLANLVEELKETK
jgi:hypothetical protein